MPLTEKNKQYIDGLSQEALLSRTTNEGWTEYTEGMELPDGAIWQARWPDWGGRAEVFIYMGSQANVQRVSEHRGRMEFRELIPLHEAEELAREAWAEGLSGDLDIANVEEFLAEWRERRKG